MDAPSRAPPADESRDAARGEHGIMACCHGMVLDIVQWDTLPGNTTYRRLGHVFRGERRAWLLVLLTVSASVAALLYVVARRRSAAQTAAQTVPGRWASNAHPGVAQVPAAPPATPPAAPPATLPATPGLPQRVASLAGQSLPRVRRD